VIRRCLRCGETWRVPGDLAAPPRRTGFRRGGGVSAVDYMATRGMHTNAMAGILLNMAKERSRPAGAQPESDAQMAACPSCGAVGVYGQTRVPRRWDIKRLVQHLLRQR